jgi:hypothetical protein
MDRSMIGKPSKANQMLRSNSSHGGFSGINSQNNASVTKSPSNNQVRKVENILKGSLDLIPPPSVKIQIMGGKACLRCKGKTLLGVVNKDFGNQKVVGNVLPYYLK